MNGIRRWSKAHINEVLEGTSRQYFVGDLQRPQVLPFERDHRLEIGLTSYQQQISERPHRHVEATEFQYVVSGMTEYLDLDTGTVHRFIAGDFFSIHSPTAYAQRSKAGTRILFVKVPSTDDKVPVEASPEVSEWMSQSIPSRRTDYWHDPHAPSANSVQPATAVAVLDGRRGDLLMLRRCDSGNWTMPGGTLEWDESLPECAVREVHEETGLEIVLDALVGVYTDPDARIAYSDGEVRREFSVLYATHVEDADVHLDLESTDWAWVPLEKVTELQLADSQRRRVTDVIEWVRTGKTRLG